MELLRVITSYSIHYTKLYDKFYLPVDCVAAEKFAADAQTKVVPIQEVPAEWMMLMSALSAGRSISLPSLSVGASRLASYNFV